MDATTRGALIVGARVALAHHPLCSYFGDDVFRWGRTRVCSGCALAIPALLLGLLAGAGLARVVPAPFLLAGGLLLGIPQLLSYLARGSRVTRAATKLAGGLGLGVVLVAILALRVGWPWRLGLLGAMGASFVVLQAIRMRAIWRTCQACPWKARWDACPGFAADARNDPLR